MSLRKHNTFQERRAMEQLHKLQDKMRRQLETRGDYRVWIELQRQVMAILPAVPNYKTLKKKAWWL